MRALKNHKNVVLEISNLQSIPTAFFFAKNGILATTICTVYCGRFQMHNQDVGVAVFRSLGEAFARGSTIHHVSRDDAAEEPFPFSPFPAFRIWRAGKFTTDRKISSGAKGKRLQLPRPLPPFSLMGRASGAFVYRSCKLWKSQGPYSLNIDHVHGAHSSSSHVHISRAPNSPSVPQQWPNLSNAAAMASPAPGRATSFHI